MLWVIYVTSAYLYPKRKPSGIRISQPPGADISMATAQHPVAPKIRAGVQPLRAGEGNSFIWRKLHSLLGIIPIGAFFLEHLLSNFEALKGPAAYGAQVKFLNSLPLVRVLEWTFIFLPLLYHGLYGVYIWLRGKSNVVYYPWAGNWMYVAQRWTGMVSLVYIIQHVLRQRFLGADLPNNPGMAFAKVQHGVVESLHAGLLCNCDDRRLLALRLRHLAVRGQVGHYSRRDGAATLRLGLPRRRRSALRHGTGQHLGFHRAKVPERAG